MNSKKIILSTAVFFLSLSKAQQTRFFTDKEDFQFGIAENLFQTKVYNSAQYRYTQQYFYNKYLSDSRREAARFFDNVIGVLLQKNNAEQGLEAFMKEYPNSTYFAEANLPLADYYLAKKDFPKALETLKKINQSELSRDENAQYTLKLGYAKFMEGDTKGAIMALEEAYRNSTSTENADIAYMLGHLYYSDGQTNKAFNYFDKIKYNQKFADLVQPYYVQMYFNQKNYDKAIDEGNKLLNNNQSSEYQSEVHKIIGESYFMKKDYASAYPHLKIYLEQQAQPSESDLYEMGFVSAQLGKYDEAVSYYNQLTNSSSSFSQNAYYQLGNAYLQTGKKQEALSAFRSAYQMNYDAKVQQLAHEQYAKLSYNIGNPFDSAPKVIQAYISKYPNSAKKAEMEQLLVKSYLYSGDYKGTLEAIDKLPNSNKETDKIDQEVSFLLGTEEFNKGNFDEAEKYLVRSLELNENKEVNNRATYWLAQTYYQKGNYPSAIVRYERLLNENFPEKQQLPYDLGYAYFKSKKFDKAQQYFKNYLKNPKEEYKNDAELRLADTYYADNQLNEAIAIYDKADNADDYTLYQRAMALGFKGETATKISSLKDLISKYPNSEYKDDAEYEIASAYAQQEDFGNANQYFDKVIKNSTDAGLVADAKIYKVQNYISMNQKDKALSEFRILGNEYKNTAYASKVVQAARPIFAEKGDTAGYESFAKNIGVKIDASDIEEINLTTAQQLYAKKDFTKAIPYYEKYLAQKPTGEGLYQAQYELGESYYQTKNENKALALLLNLASVQNDYQEDARTRVAQIYISQNKWEEASTQLLALEHSSNPNIKNFANIELMKIFAQKKDFQNAEKRADEVLKNTKNSASVLESAKAIKGRSLMNKGKDKDAQATFATLEKSSNPEVAAEALYAKAFYQNKAKAYKMSNETIFKLANNYASEDYWGAKSLLIMAKNYIGLKDKYQATYTIDQVLGNYQDFPDVIAEAKEIKKGIK